MSEPVLAPYACNPENSRGRLIAESTCPMRNDHQRDRDRIIHSTSFRRLEYKTQVFVNHEGDHYRTRLTHSLEVSQLARSLARNLRLNEDLAECLALAHDLGHTPFGHAGEDGLHEAMANFGGFDHNAQTIRILTRLEQRYAAYDGLNLTWETLEGIAKHNGPVVGAPPRALAQYIQRHDLELHTYASAEAQVAAIADDIAYNNHDLDDGLRAGFFTLDDLCALPMLGELIAQVRGNHPGLSTTRQAHEVIRTLIARMMADVLAHTRSQVEALGIGHVNDVRALGKTLVCFSAEMEEIHRAMKRYLMTHMYRHPRVNRMTSKARRVVRAMFEFFVSEPNCLPLMWYEQTQGASAQATAEIVADFIAGMTDRFALEEYARLFDVSART